MINPLKALLFLAGGTAVAGVAAYATGALDPLFKSPPAAVAEAPEKPATAKTGDEAATKESRLEGSEKPAASPAPASDQGAQGEQKPQAPEIAAIDPNKPIAEDAAPQPVAPADGSPVPTFDLVRVEADGSMVIAGKAAPKARVELLTAGDAIGEGRAGEGGDFVIVLDKPLAPGDYQITIRATNPQAAVASTQTAIVSIPKEAGGQVLAMIEEPGKPSEIITVPQPAPSATAAQPTEQKPAEAASEQPAGSDGAAGQAKPNESVAQADPAKPAETAAAEPTPAQQPAVAQPGGPTPDVAVEAVEIDGPKVFVAGRAPAGSSVRVYAGESPLGESKASPAGRFLVEALKDLPVGNYIVRADVIGPDGVQVIARAAVPFEREPGENIAAVAPPSDGSVGSGSGPFVPAPDAAPANAATPAAGEAPSSGAQGTAAASADAQPSGNAGQQETGEWPAPAVPAQAPAATGEPAPSGATAAGTADQSAPPAASQPADVAAAATATQATAPALQPVASAVIIRRGDSLWRISKRVYGRGIRYSTIYLANQDQIRDPDLIWPGQVFNVPGKTEEGEAADMTRMGDQATSKSE
ncbi:LysM peptidoglycan-binding domain-containing protein [Arvimicrobium flavum]|uniref:LysM peptidoglycan-binding domain-containing protein n=1 Tax=Arvimicrobium flavum TaxID=3393320 RepID=UPI00237BD6F5|nr:LysM peptidoglycan-binding domain-containing protein [Mesorhizobium shangrilense]